MGDEDSGMEIPNRNDGDECWMDLYDDVDATEKTPLTRFKISDRVQAMHLLSDDAIVKFIIGDICVKGRKCMACPNDRECAEMFGSVKVATETIRNFRRKYWDAKIDAGQQYAGQIFERRKQLYHDIDTMKVYNKETGKLLIEYKIDGIFVCKSFFHVRTRKHYCIANFII